MRIVVIGSRGQVARSIQERACGSAHSVFTLGRPILDLTIPSSIIPAICPWTPDLIINAAAYTAVDAAETDETLAHKINGEGAAAVSAVAEHLGIPVIHFSTDYVFDGKLDRPYQETDAPAPINAYGRSKLAGEEAVKSATTRHVILRTSWVYSPFNRNFVRTMLEIGTYRDNVRVVDDQVGHPTSALDIADAVLAICDNLLARPNDGRLFGTFHLSGTGVASWADFAEAIFSTAERYDRSKVAVTRIASDQYLTAARRPMNSRLNGKKLAEIHGICLPSWQTSLDGIVARLIEGN